MIPERRDEFLRTSGSLLKELKVAATGEKKGKTGRIFSILKNRIWESIAKSTIAKGR